MQSNHTKNKHQAQHQHNNRINLEPGALVGIQPQHGAARASRARSAGAVGSGIGDLLLLVGSSTAADGGAGASWRGGGRRAGAGCDACWAACGGGGGGGAGGGHCWCGVVWCVGLNLVEIN